MILTWQQIPNTLISEILTYNKFDGVVLDIEHGVFPNDILTSCIQVVTLTGKKCFVRLPEINRTAIKYALDSGANGLIFANITNTEEADKIIEYSCYPTRGCGLVRENKWGKEPLAQVKPQLIIQIESIQGVNNLDSLLEYSFDYFLVGPYDLSLSLGKAGDFQDPDFINMVAKLEESIPREKLGYHIVTMKDILDKIGNLKDIGFLALGMDTTLLTESMENIEKLI